MQEALSLIPQNHIKWMWWYMPVILALGVRAKESQIQVILDYVVSLRSAWTPGDPRGEIEKEGGKKSKRKRGRGEEERKREEGEKKNQFLCPGL